MLGGIKGFRSVFKSGVIQIFENSNIWNNSKCSDLIGQVILVDLKVAAWDLIWNYLFVWFVILLPQVTKTLQPAIHFNNAIVSVIALGYCLHWGPNAMMQAIVVLYSCMFCYKHFLTYAWEKNKSCLWQRWKIINCTEKYWSCYFNETKLCCYRSWPRLVCFRIIKFLLK